MLLDQDRIKLTSLVIIEFKKILHLHFISWIQFNFWFFFESQFTEQEIINNNTPPMPLLDAHLGGLFFLRL